MLLLLVVHCGLIGRKKRGKIAYSLLEAVLMCHAPFLHAHGLKASCRALEVFEGCWCAWQREAFILEDLKDANIVQFMGACFDEGSTMLVTEFMAGGNLFDAIGNDRDGKLGWYQRCALSPSEGLCSAGGGCVPLHISTVDS